MPNRDHDDTPYNRYEGRFEGSRDERGDWRDQNPRGSREWDRNFDDPLRRAERARAQFDHRYDSRSQYEGYNPSRDEYEYRGGSRYEERGRYGQGNGQTVYGARSYQGVRNADDDARWRQSEGLRGGGQYGGSFGDYSGGNDWSPDYASRSSFGRPQSGYGYDRDRGYGGQSVYGGAQDWNRDYYARDARTSGGGQQQRDYRRDDNDWGDQLRHAGQQMIGRVKRAFRGPKGYKRSDERIREDVNDRLAQQDEIDPSDIEVRVENGDVTLTGTVRNRHEKFRAEEIADAVSGVNDVHNQLRVGEAQTGQTQTFGSTSGTSASTGTSAPSTTRNGRA